MKKTVSIILSIIMLLGAATTTSLSAFAADYSNDPDTALTLMLENTRYSGEFTANNRVDWFKINLDDSAEFTLSVCSYSDIYFMLFSEDFNRIDYTNPIGSDLSPATNEISDVLSEGTYYLRVYPYSDRNGKYWFKADAEFFDTDEIEENDCMDDAMELEAGETVTSALTCTDSTDWYKLTLPSASNIKILISNKFYLDTIALYSGDLLTTYFDKRNFADTPFAYSINLNAGTYYLKIYDSAYSRNTGKYTVKWEYEVGAPTELKAVPSENSVKLSWKAAQGASDYEIQQYKDGKWTLLGTTSQCTYTVSSLTAGKDYQFRVKACKSAGGSRYIGGTKSINAGTKSKAVKLTSAKSAKKKSLTVKWSNTACSGYQVQYSTKSSFKGAKTVLVSKTNTTLKNLKGGVKYYVRVRSYKTIGGVNYYSAWSNAKSAKAKK